MAGEGASKTEEKERRNKSIKERDNGEEVGKMRKL